MVGLELRMRGFLMLYKKIEMKYAQPTL